MKNILLFLALASSAFAQEMHSSVAAYIEGKQYNNSNQKEDAVVYGLGADLHFGNAEYKIAYEEGKAKTKGPTYNKFGDLETSKLFFKFAYKFDKRFSANVNYISVLKDNIAITDGGYSGGGGITYTFNKKLSFNFTEYFSDYDDFDVFQSDLRIDYKTRFDQVKVKFSSITKYITLHDDDVPDHFTKFAQDKYFTTGVQAHAHYKTYHLGGTAYFGKRAFAIMQDGFKLQHHAMEFDRTYAIGAGKSFYNFVFRLQYIYQRATELPTENEDVDVSTLRFITNYKF